MPAKALPRSPPLRTYPPLASGRYCCLATWRDTCEKAQALASYT
jgi:hypothetical protein